MYWKNGNLLLPEFLDDAPPQVPMVYEVLRVFKHESLFLTEHLERFFHSVELLGLDKPCSMDQMKANLNELLDSEPERIGNIKIRLSWCPEPVLEFGYIPHAYPSRQEQSNGVSVATVHAIRDTPNAKKWNAALRARTNQVMKETGVYEVLLVNAQGNITEGSRSNLFYVKDSVLYTAPVESVLPGITRQKVVELAKGMNIELIEQYLPEAGVNTADEIFISGTSPGIQPVAEVNGIPLPVSRPVTMRLQEAYNKQVEKELGSNDYE